MAPTSKAAEKCVLAPAAVRTGLPLTPFSLPSSPRRMGGVQAKLSETEKQVEKARKESATAREAFNAVRKQR